MRITEAANLIVEASMEEEQAAQRGVGLDEVGRAAIRLGLAIHDKRDDKHLLEVADALGVLAAMSAPGAIDYDVYPAIERAVQAQVLAESGDRDEVPARIEAVKKMLDDGSAKRLMSLKLDVHVRDCQTDACTEAAFLLEKSELGPELIMLARAYSFDAWSIPNESLKYVRDWDYQAATLGRILAAIAKSYPPKTPGPANVSKHSRGFKPSR